MKSVSKFAAATLLGLTVLGGTASVASAAVVCNGEGQCWHVRGRYNYRPEWGVVVHPNNWRWGRDEHYEWREHRGRGYWHGGDWVRF